VFLEAANRKPAAQLDLEIEFFKQLPVLNGTFKTTRAQRLDALNLLFQDQVLPRWKGQRVRLLDVGVSSGITTVDWAEALRRQGWNFAMVGTDLILDATLQSYGSFIHVLNSRAGVLQFEVGGLAMGDYIGAGVTSRVRRTVPVLGCRLLIWTLQQMCRCHVGPKPVLYPLRLLSRRAMDDPDIEFIEEDLLGDLRCKGSFHVIRAANILNPRYFSSECLLWMLNRLRGRLEKDGVLVVVRTDADGTNHGGVYEFDGKRFLKLALTIGRGSEIHNLIVDGALPAKAAVNL
jgi:hypothetical protein